MYPTIFDTEELNALRDLACRFATEKLAPGYQAREAAGGFGADLVREMGSLGLIAPELPEEFGGLGAGAIYSGVIIEEIARGDFNFGYINILASLNGQILAHFANDEIRREWLPRLIAGELMIAIALTEPRGGSDAANLGLRMERAGDHYIINGEKTPISAADQARGAVVFARTGRRTGRMASPRCSCRWTRPAFPPRASLIWASMPSAAARSSSTMCACRWTTGSARRARASCR